ncbi:MAG TPA: type II toxin-antitoxin system RelE/ParE family toxin [Bryobacteraceae bacterium]
MFVHGFAKNEKENIERSELIALRKLAAELLEYDDDTLTRTVAVGALTEIAGDAETIP